MQQAEAFNLKSYTVHTVHYLHVGNNQHSFIISGHQVFFMVYTKISNSSPTYIFWGAQKPKILTTKHPNYPRNIPIVCVLDTRPILVLHVATMQFHWLSLHLIFAYQYIYSCMYLFMNTFVHVFKILKSKKISFCNYM